jgi:hypothetical protein
VLIRGRIFFNGYTWLSESDRILSTAGAERERLLASTLVLTKRKKKKKTSAINNRDSVQYLRRRVKSYKLYEGCSSFLYIHTIRPMPQINEPTFDEHEHQSDLCNVFNSLLNSRNTLSSIRECQELVNSLACLVKMRRPYEGTSFLS